MISLDLMPRFAEPLPEAHRHAHWRGPAVGGKRVSALPLTPSTTGMLDGGEGTTGPRTRHPCLGPFAHGDQARRAQGSRGPAELHDDSRSPFESTTRVRVPLDQHTTPSSDSRGACMATFGLRLRPSGPSDHSDEHAPGLPVLVHEGSAHATGPRLRRTDRALAMTRSIMLPSRYRHRVGVLEDISKLTDRAYACRCQRFDGHLTVPDA